MWSVLSARQTIYFITVILCHLANKLILNELVLGNILHNIFVLF